MTTRSYGLVLDCILDIIDRSDQYKYTAPNGTVLYGTECLIIPIFRGRSTDHNPRNSK